MLDRHTSGPAYCAAMKRISLFVSERQYKEFLALSTAMGQPYAELIREALNNYLREHRPAHAPSKKRAAGKRVGARKPA
jgi:metal-responsive CopG/Arc/MetJ family transcriptional regulator